MKYCRIFYILIISIILPMLVMFPAIPAHAGDEFISTSPKEGEIGDRIYIEGHGFEPNDICSIYFSSDKTSTGDSIDNQVTAYERVKTVQTNNDGDFASDYNFRVPDRLTDGEDEEDVHGGDYYIYVTYHDINAILDAAEFTVIGGEIEIDPEEGQVGTEVEISGKRFGITQTIIFEYDSNVIDIASGNKETDSNGEFTSTIIIPESNAGAHTITVIDESGNKPEAEFSVKPKIFIYPTSGAVGNVIEVRGTGFGDKEYITINLDGLTVSTTPTPLSAKRNGNFTGSFLVPPHVVSGTSIIKASDSSLNSAETELTIMAGLSLNPATDQTSPGHVGMELTAYGTGFIAKATVTIIYGESISVATATTDAAGNFSVTFTAPPSVADNYIIAATDGTNTLTSTFTMESEAPPIPVPLLPEVATTTEPEAYFDWEDVTDPSGITYTLQIGTNTNFTTIVLEKERLTDSEYTIAPGQKLELTEADAPYYWRIKAVDGASNEGKWTIPLLFYVGHSQSLMPSWTLYVWITLGALLLGVLGFWITKRIRE